jgi:hypothetical protein
MRAPRRLIVTIAAGALAVAGGSTQANAHDGGGNRGKRRRPSRALSQDRGALLAAAAVVAVALADIAASGA